MGSYREMPRDSCKDLKMAGSKVMIRDIPKGLLMVKQKGIIED